MLNFLNKKTAGPSSDQADAYGRFIKLIVSQAVAQQATKIVLGVPCEANCRRIPWEPRLVQDCPWDWEDEARLTGRNEADVVEKRKARVESSRKDYAERRYE
jgi:hypothetical protein